ncbi:glycosyl hydrolase family 32 [Microbacterium sp. HMWF026]|uniref:glycoside hydrolase family 68 protein n=1 Tax=Microbacterium sp. HMWF026 TaxID=2056861 RepID=UPI000D33C0D4|nr:glycoside hydrolase family 68 protein [Microbacterium sp. HMWF026]PTT16600.1 glycosyl hydrolase family 32 [Microbacterium sp. HMWF026]
MFDLADSYVWDFWFADDGDRYHLFFLYASRALHDPEDRHYRASVGHAVSTDLVSWERVADALVRGGADDFDALATWTGSTVRRADGTWFLFYTGSRLAEDGRNVQRVGYATSSDLYTWHKNTANPVLEADGEVYERLATTEWHDEAFRDPWVFADPAGVGWHMYVTARATHGPLNGRGVVAHATSPDLETWELQAPVSAPTERGFGQLEVTQVEQVDGRAVLLFSCMPAQAMDAVRERHPRGAVWAVPADDVLGPFDIEAATPITDDDLYVGRLIQDRAGAWQLLAFRNVGPDGTFVGGITDPLPVGWDGDRLVVKQPATVSA